ncbi:hypothetical protein [Algibacter pacificus]|uniref:hypothetical protein n=1 Tax=Algibacter pacificus TaxID=2599389 RepID=UPI0016502D3A|nr:hypothetical protein [Algibacter pacificus]
MIPKGEDFFIDSNTEKSIVKLSYLNKNFKRIYLTKNYNKNSGYKKASSERLETYLKLKY